MSVALLHAAQGTSDSMLREPILTMLPGAIKMADGSGHFVDQSGKVRRAQVMVSSKFNASLLVSTHEQVDRRCFEIFGFAK